MIIVLIAVTVYDDRKGENFARCKATVKCQPVNRWLSPDLELLVQIVDLPDELQVLGREGPPVADEHETRQEQSSDQERRTSASADSHTVDSHH